MLVVVSVMASVTACAGSALNKKSGGWAAVRCGEVRLRVLHVEVEIPAHKCTLKKKPAVVVVIIIIILK